MAMPKKARELFFIRHTWYGDYAYRAGCVRERRRLLRGTVRVSQWHYMAASNRLCYIYRRLSREAVQPEAFKAYCAHERYMRRYRKLPSAVDYEGPF